MTKICKRYLISGRVQQVWYRANTELKAKELGVTGWARNLSDGRVEVVALAEHVQLEQFENWLWIGPELASVDDIIIEYLADQSFIKFEIIK